MYNPFLLCFLSLPFQLAFFLIGLAGFRYKKTGPMILGPVGAIIKKSREDQEPSVGGSGFFNLTPGPSVSVAERNLIPAFSNADWIAIKVWAVERGTPLVLSIRWMVGKLIPECSANLLACHRSKARADRICSEVNITVRQS